MAVNLYDSPAQAQFINTYVPIKFEGLYKFAEQARIDHKQAEAALGKLSDDYSFLDTPSQKAAEVFKTRGSDVVMQAIENDFADPNALKSAEGRAKLAALTRKLSKDTELQLAITQSPKLAEFIRRSDPRWNGLEAQAAMDWDPSKGAFNMTNVAYKSIGEMYDPAVSGLKPEHLGMSPDGKLMITGISADRVASQIIDYNRALSEDPAYKLHVQNLKRSPQGMAFAMKNEDGSYATNEKGELIYDEASMMAAAGYSAHSDLVHSRVEYNPEWLENLRHERQLALARFNRESAAPTGQLNLFGYAVRQIGAASLSGADNYLFDSARKLLNMRTNSATGQTVVNIPRGADAETKAALDLVRKVESYDRTIKTLEARKAKATADNNQSELLKVNKELSRYQAARNNTYDNAIVALKSVHEKEVDRLKGAGRGGSTTNIGTSAGGYYNAASVAAPETFVAATSGAYFRGKSPVNFNGEKVTAYEVQPTVGIDVESGFNAGTLSSGSFGLKISEASRNGKLNVKFAPSGRFTPNRESTGLTQSGNAYITHKDLLNIGITEDQINAEIRRGSIMKSSETRVDSQTYDTIEADRIYKIPARTSNISIDVLDQYGGGGGATNNVLLNTSGYLDHFGPR